MNPILTFFQNYRLARRQNKLDETIESLAYLRAKLEAREEFCINKLHGGVLPSIADQIIDLRAEIAQLEVRRERLEKELLRA